MENRYDLDRYDEEVENENTMEIETLILNNPPESNSEDSDAEEDEFVVKPSDNLILAAHITGNVSMLEAYGRKSYNPKVCMKTKPIIKFLLIYSIQS